MKRVGRYELGAVLGKSAASVVHRARSDDGREVAIKILRATTAYASSRFERELRLTKLLGEAAGFVPFIEALETPQGPALVMPFLPGGTLRARLESGRLPVSEVVGLGRSLAATLGRAHAQGIVHRDVKPENILFNAAGRPLLADLGIAKHFDKATPGAAGSLEITRARGVLGTMGYMAPEQFEDALHAGPPADVFGLGAVLYECLAGHEPFVAGSTAEIIAKVLKGEKEPLSKERPDAPPWLVEVIEQAMRRAPAERFPDGAAFARALEGPASPSTRADSQTSSGDQPLPVAAPPRGSPAALVALGALLVLALVGAAALVVLGRREPPAPPVVPAPPPKPPAPPPPPAKPAFVAPPWAKAFARSKHLALTGAFGDTSPDCHHSYVDQFALSADGKKALTSHWSEPIVEWDLDGGPAVEHADGFNVWTGTNGLAFGPKGPRAASFQGGVFKRWSPGERKGSTIATIGSRAGGALSRDGERALTVVAGRAEVLDATSGERLATVEHDALGRSPRALAVWSGPDLIAVADSSVVVVGLRTFTRLVGHGAYPSCVELSPDRRFVFTSAMDGTLRCWRLDDGTEVFRSTDSQSVTAIAVSPDGATLLDVSGTRVARRNAASGAIEKTFVTADVPRWCAFTPDGRLAAIATQRGTIEVLDVRTGELVRRVGVASRGNVRSVRECTGGAYLVAAFDKGAALIDAKTGAEEPIPGDHSWGCALRPDGSVVSLATEGTLRVQGPNGELVAERTLRGSASRHSPIALSPDGRRALVVGDGGVAYALELETAAQTTIALGGAKEHWASAALTDDGRALLVLSDKSELQLWDLAVGTPILKRKSSHGWTKSCALSRDGTFALVPGNDGADLWELEHEKPRARLSKGKQVAGAAFLPKGRAVTISSHPSTLQLWDVSSGEKIDELDLAGARGQLHSISGSEAGRSFLVGTGSGKILRFETVD